MVSGNELGDLGVNELQAVGYGDLRGFDEAECDRGELRSLLADDAVANASDAGIDAKDDHRLNLRRRSPLGHVMVMGRPWGQR